MTDLASRTFERLLKYHKVTFLYRALIALCILGFHATLFSHDFRWSQWLVVLPHTLLYPLAIYLFCSTRECERRTIFVDAAVYGYYAALWGFNPLVVCVVVTATIVTSIASGGLTYLRLALITLAAGTLGSTLIHGIHYRPELPLLSNLLVMLATFLYFGSVSYVFYVIGNRLKKSKVQSGQQHAELLQIHNITHAASATLNLSGVMKGLMQVLQELYPLESVFMIAYDTQKTGIDILGCHSDELTDLEKEAYRKFSFDVKENIKSLYVTGMEKNRIIYVENVEEEFVQQGPQVDQELYAIRPIKSLAFFPVSLQSKVVAGVVFVNYVHQLKLKPKDLDKIQSYLIQIGPAIRNVRMYHDVRKTRDLAKQARVEAEIAKQKAEESEDAKSHFLANMSHEIRTPMTAILGYSEALSDEGISAQERKEYTQTIIRSGKHLLSIINDILDISKIEASKIEVESLEVNLPQLIADVESYVSIKVKEQGLSYSLLVDYPLPVYISTDPTRLKQILFNLVNNAVKFTEKGSVTIRVGIMEDQQLSFHVVDTGIGLTMAEQGKLFKPFSQTDASVTRVYGGTGLGLYISQSLARLLGGDISVLSKKGKGSDFHVTLALNMLDTTKVNSRDEFIQFIDSNADDRRNSGVPKLSGRVLVAEDNLENQRLVKRLIERTGIDVCLVDNGRDAVLNASYKTYNLILMDMQMPIMGGREAARRIKELAITTPMVAFTANVMKHQVQEYQDMGFVAVIEKPIVQETLFQVLETYLEKGSIDYDKGKVLIVEDNSVNRMVMQRMVAKVSDKLEIQLAEHGEQALKMAEKTQFDLILMDMEMPVMDGLEATRTLRKRGFKGHIAMVTGNIEPEHVHRCIETGADAHLAKPIDKAALYALIDGLFKH